MRRNGDGREAQLDGESRRLSLLNKRARHERRRATKLLRSLSLLGNYQKPQQQRPSNGDDSTWHLTRPSSSFHANPHHQQHHLHPHHHHHHHHADALHLASSSSSAAADGNSVATFVPFETTPLLLGSGGCAGGGSLGAEYRGEWPELDVVTDSSLLDELNHRNSVGEGAFDFFLLLSLPPDSPTSGVPAKCDANDYSPPLPPLGVELSFWKGLPQDHLPHDAADGHGLRWVCRSSNLSLLHLPRMASPSGATDFDPSSSVATALIPAAVPPTTIATSPSSALLSPDSGFSGA